MACMYRKVLTICYLHTNSHLFYCSHPHHTPFHFVGHYRSPHHSAAHPARVMRGQCQLAHIGPTACNVPTLLSETEFYCYKYGSTYTLNVAVHTPWMWRYTHFECGGTHTSNVVVHTLWMWRYAHFECGGTHTSNMVVHTLRMWRYTHFECGGTHTLNVVVHTLRIWWYTLQIWQYTHFKYGGTHTSNMAVCTLWIWWYTHFEYGGTHTLNVAVRTHFKYGDTHTSNLWYKNVASRSELNVTAVQVVTQIRKSLAMKWQLMLIIQNSTTVYNQGWGQSHKVHPFLDLFWVTDCHTEVTLWTTETITKNLFSLSCLEM